jgi:hypothetical protein
MALRGLLRPKRPLDVGKNAATLQDARSALRQALKLQRERLAVAQSEAVDVQLLGQVTSPREWPKLLAYWERRNPSGVASWPRRLDRSAHALNLWPLPAGRVGRAAGLGGDVKRRAWRRRAGMSRHLRTQAALSASRPRPQEPQAVQAVAL